MIRHALPIALILLTGCPTPEEQAADVFTQAQLSHEAGDLDNAIAGYGLAIDLDPQEPAMYLHRAEARLVNGDVDGAFADCEKVGGTVAMNIDSGEPYVHNTFKQYYSDHHPLVFRLVRTGLDDY